MCMYTETVGYSVHGGERRGEDRVTEPHHHLLVVSAPHDLLSLLLLNIDIDIALRNVIRHHLPTHSKISSVHVPSWELAAYRTFTSGALLPEEKPAIIFCSSLSRCWSACFTKVPVDTYHHHHHHHPIDIRYPLKR